MKKGDDFSPPYVHNEWKCFLNKSSASSIITHSSFVFTSSNERSSNPFTILSSIETHSSKSILTG